MKKDKILEYYEGNPDTIDEFDDENGEYITSYGYNNPNVISFAYFQTSLDGDKEFIYNKELSHYAISGEIAKKIIGKAYASEDVDHAFVSTVTFAIYSNAAYKGRVFLNINAITTWTQVSSRKLAEIVENMGGIEKFEDFVYVNPDANGRDNISVIDYINSNIEAKYEKNEEELMSHNIKDSSMIEPWMIDLIREYNTPNSKLADKTSKLGNMTIAQYNSLIHQEEKEPKKTIKENKDNMKNNKHQEEFSNYIKIMNEALQKNDYKAYEYVKEMLDEAVDESKHEKELMNELNTINFGVLNHIFESELPTLIKTNKKAVRNVIKTIKEDKNLQSQFSFYNVIKEQYNSSHAEMITPEVALEKLVKIVCEEIDPKTIKKSNKKLRDVMIENNIIPSDFIDEESKKLYENGNVILTTKRTSNNMLPLAESYDAVCKWMAAHKDDKVKNTKDVDTLVREFEEKLKTNLNESEMSFVQEITDFRSPIAEKRKEKLFNKFKNECISKINDMLKEDTENAELKGLSEQINEMTFDKNNIVKDIAKLLEIRDILMDD